MQADSTANKVPPEWELRPLFQPIVALNQGITYGYEGLIRALNSATGELLTPYIMFDEAIRGDFLHDLDYRCREVIIETFASRFSWNDETRLFLNVHPHVIGDTAVSKQIQKIATRCNIMPENIVIEIDECRITDTGALEAFVANCRHHGFGLALDDFGVFPCNPERIPLIRPEVLKIDISLVREMSNNEHAGLAVRTLVQLAARTGSSVIAEGVETEEEAIRVMEAGCRNIQGFYFSRPVEITKVPHLSVQEKTSLLLEHMATKKPRAGMPDTQEPTKPPVGETPGPDYVIMRS